MTLPRALQPQFRAVGEVRQLERAGHDSGNVRLIPEDLDVRPADVRGLRIEPQRAVRDRIHHGDAAVLGDGQHAIAQIPDEVTVEALRDGISRPASAGARLGGCARGDRRGTAGRDPRFTNRHDETGRMARERLGRQYCNCPLPSSQGLFLLQFTVVTPAPAAKGRSGDRRVPSPADGAKGVPPGQPGAMRDLLGFCQETWPARAASITFRNATYNSVCCSASHCDIRSPTSHMRA